MKSEALNVKTESAGGEFTVSLTNTTGLVITDLTIVAQAPDGQDLADFDVPSKLAQNAMAKGGMTLETLEHRAGRVVIKGKFQDKHSPKSFTRIDPVEYQ